MPRDIVYILKETLDTDELRYSLRSVEANFPHRFVWFVGGQPAGFKPDRALPHQQTGANKWEQIRSSMLRVAREPELSEEFFVTQAGRFVAPVTVIESLYAPHYRANSSFRAPLSSTAQ